MAQRKNLFWDLGNTLLKISRFSLARQLGLFDFIVYSLSHGADPHKLFHKMLDLLDLLEIPHKEPCGATAHGRTLPPIVCQWLSGDLDKEQIQTYLEKPLFLQAPQGFFASAREARLIQNFLEILTTPETLASLVEIIADGKQLLKECAEQTDSQGNQLHSLFVLSNWDPYSIEPMMKALHLQELFEYFNKSNLIISGEVGTIKPHDKIYSYILNTFDLVPSDCILIDDQPENIAGAHKHGIQGILLKKGNYQDVRSKLQKYQVL